MDAAGGVGHLPVEQSSPVPLVLQSPPAWQGTQAARVLRSQGQCVGLMWSPDITTGEPRVTEHLPSAAVG